MRYSIQFHCEGKQSYDIIFYINSWMVIIVNDFRFEQLIDRLSEPAFHHCVHVLWPLMSYKYLSESDIRKIDLKEWLYNVSEPYFGKKHSPTCVFDKYAETMNGYFEERVLCVPGSVAEAYYARAKSILGKDREKMSLDDLESICAILILLARSEMKQTGKKQLPIKEVEFKIEYNDIDILKHIKDLKPVNKNILKNPKDAVQPLIDKVSKPRLPDIETYVINTLLLCRMLQIQGVYVAEEE